MVYSNWIYILFEHNSALKLFDQKIFDSPTNFKNLIYNEKEFNSYNKIDMSFFLNETTIIKKILLLILKRKI